MTSDDPAAIAASYRAFAQHQARGRSSAYESLAEAVAADPALRARFITAVRGLGATWLSSEEPGVLPGIDHRGPDDLASVLARDGLPIAHADSHGTWLRWLES